MARMKVTGLDTYSEMLKKLGKRAEEIEGRAIYEGAKIVADEVRKGIDSLPVISGYGTENRPLPGGVTASQKEGLQDGFGVTPIGTQNGFLNVQVGFDGYNSTRTKEFPQGQPNQLIARGAESGTSWKQKHPFVRPAVNRARNPALKKMEETIDKEIEKIKS